VVADRDAGDFRPDGLDDAGALVTHDDGRRSRPFTVHDVEVGVANPARPEPD
jgi:hypothetical protein